MEKILLKDVKTDVLKNAILPALKCDNNVSIRLRHNKMEYIAKQNTAFFKRHEVLTDQLCENMDPLEEGEIVHIFLFNGKSMINTLSLFDKKCDVEIVYGYCDVEDKMVCKKLLFINNVFKIDFLCASLKLGYYDMTDAIKHKIFDNVGDTMTFDITATQLKHIDTLLHIDNTNEEPESFKIYKEADQLKAGGPGFEVILQQNYTNELIDCEISKDILGMLDDVDYKVDVCYIKDKNQNDTAKAVFRSKKDFLESGFGLLKYVDEPGDDEMDSNFKEFEDGTGGFYNNKGGE